MWTAKLASVTEAKQFWTYVIVFSDGTDAFKKSFNTTTLDNRTVQNAARNEIDKLESVALSVGKLSYREGDDIDTSPQAPDTPTAEVLARMDFVAALESWLRLKKAASYGLIAVDDSRIAVAEALMKSLWSEQYFGAL